MASKIETEIREEFMSAVRELFEGKGEDVLQVKSGTISIPWVRGDDEGYLNIAFSIPKGERDKENKCYIPYDGYEEAQNYRKPKQSARRGPKPQRRKQKKSRVTKRTAPKQSASAKNAKRKRRRVTRKASPSFSFVFRRRTSKKSS